MDLNLLKENLSNFFNTNSFSVKFYKSGASSRRYYLVNFRNSYYFPNPNILLATYSHSENGSFDDYIKMDYYFKRRNIPTPRIFEINRHQRWIFLEYIPFPTVEEYLKAYPEKTAPILEALLEMNLLIQQTCLHDAHCPAFHRQFDKAKFMFEFNFHVREQLLGNYFHYQLQGKEEQTFLKFAEEISTALDVPEKVFVHRDFQSSNILCASESYPLRFKIIDFQDARLGNPIYDVVSLLWDSYIDVDETLREELLDRQFHQLHELGFAWDRDYYRKLVDYSVIQRKLHDAGAFAYNFHRFKSDKYLNYIPGSIRMAMEKMEKYKAFTSIIQIFSKMVGESF